MTLLLVVVIVGHIFCLGCILVEAKAAQELALAG